MTIRYKSKTRNLLRNYLTLLGVNYGLVQTTAKDADGHFVHLLHTPAPLVHNWSKLSELAAVTAGEVTVEDARRLLQAVCNVGVVRYGFDMTFRADPGAVHPTKPLTELFGVSAGVQRSYPNPGALISAARRYGQVIGVSRASADKQYLAYNPSGFIAVQGHVKHPTDTSHEMNGTYVITVYNPASLSGEVWLGNGAQNGSDAHIRDIGNPGSYGTWHAVHVRDQIRRFPGPWVESMAGLKSRGIVTADAFTAPGHLGPRGAAINAVLHGALTLPVTELTVIPVGETTAEMRTNVRLWGERAVDLNETVLVPFEALGWAVETTGNDTPYAGTMSSAERQALRDSGAQLKGMEAAVIFQRFDPGIQPKKFQDWHPDADDLEDKDVLLKAQAPHEAMTVKQFNSKFVGNRYHSLLAVSMLGAENGWEAETYVEPISNLTHVRLYNAEEEHNTESPTLVADLGENPLILAGDAVTAVETALVARGFPELESRVLSSLDGKVADFPILKENPSEKAVCEAFVSCKPREDKELAAATIQLIAFERPIARVIGTHRTDV